MIGVLYPHTVSEAGQLVLAALHRSVSSTQARRVCISSLEATELNMLVAVNATDLFGEKLLTWMGKGKRKLILFGDIPPAMTRELGCVQTEWPAEPDGWSRSAPAPANGQAQSAGSIQYLPLARCIGGNEWHRSLERFDFTDEWNNLGFGAILADGSIWALSKALNVPINNELASLQINGEWHGSYAALFDLPKVSILWFNRAVGPIDSFEWRLVEGFIASYRHEELPCHPVLREIPWGYDAAITMRLDCDEDVESARPLWNAYREMEVPFSLAVHTSNLSEEKHHPILRELIATNGSVLSHTATHAANWGGSYDAALIEGANSANALKGVTGINVKYAGSPFHQSPAYALAALADVGYQGCIGGIIRNDPEFLLARGGYLANMPQGFVGHSQQCMMHGDCMLNEGDPLAVFKQAFDRAFETHTLFGYLDHPFSERYQYGWSDEASRIETHRQFVAYIRRKASNPIFFNENDALDFLRMKSETSIVNEGSDFKVETPALCNEKVVNHSLTVEFKGKYFEAIASEKFQ